MRLGVQRAHRDNVRGSNGPRRTSARRIAFSLNYGDPKDHGKLSNLVWYNSLNFNHRLN
jgi:hypothetical protein